ncbi:PREDICTED: coiled-coil domain-containing protein 97 [Tarenaya hassleriana]|uniref:coiled-coil domain-containing protein 97 n=1 Tax=Tarenaya hassleriana TaxID=28532 RepID=UPI00053C8CDD|nr:PREDICTED: coiled-coil domain-containing protein 97 [Tarenaya hassleriana]XP_010518688.1 PREDICTED: coiled-coil domain-containing protein 97 [Tarenaya hassleriana]XP_010518689.1 PREDICTED: coiled-coil domain-containing protein 97 [Tarenaya hassleriana]
MEQGKKAVRKEAAEEISERLSSLENLYFPRAVASSTSSASHRKPLLLHLLLRDPAVFLERYGSQLTVDELREFDALNDDYEVDWHLNNLRKKMNPTSQELKSRSVAVRNRRLAYLNKLVAEGHYFSEDAMREREPYLHHEYVGKFQDLTGRSMARPGERWSETLMRRSEEARLVARIREEQQRLGVSERDWIGNEMVQEEEEEEEEESEEGEEDEEANKHAGASSRLEEVAKNGTDNNEESISRDEEGAVSPEEMQEMMEQFTYIMQQKFLSGEDHQHLDYSKIDNDETLDDHWLREVSLDAEDKYFAED